jgi:HK97 family phage major capsid protein
MNQEIKDIMARLEEMRTNCAKEGREPNTSEINESAELIKRMQALESGEVARQWAESLPQRPPIKPNPQDTGGGYRPGAPVGAPGRPSGRTYREMFYPDNPHIRLSDGGYKPGEFLAVLESGRYDDRLMRFHNTMTEGIPSEGGFSVPEVLQARWLDTSLVSEVVRPRANNQPMASATQKTAGWDMLNMTGGVCFGGYEMQYLGENQEADVQGGKLRVIEMNAKKGVIHCEASNELVADGLSFESQLEGALIAGITYGLDKGFIRGTGAGQPLGILNANSLITVDKQTGQVADTLEYQNLCDMWSRMYPVGQKNAVWIANSSVIPQLFTMGLTIGVGGAPVYVPAGGAAGAPNDTLFGRPLLFSPIMSALGDLGDILLVDLSQYIIGLRKEMSIDKSIHPGFRRDVSSYRVIIRFDGQPAWNSVFTPEHGATQSWAVTLEARN